jgi:hypothetical protein
VVVSPLPFHCAVELVRNPVPAIVTVVLAAPAVIELGLIAVIAGEGLFTAKLAAEDVPPPGAGFCTVIGSVELAAKSEAGTAAVNDVELT